MRLLILALLVIACGKHQGESKNITLKQNFGQNDPCLNSNCELVDLVTSTDPDILNRLKKYFPNFDPNTPEIKSYKTGDQFQIQKQAIFNQRYDFATQTFKDGCEIEYQENRTIYRVKTNTLNDDEELVDRIIYKYRRQNPKNITGTAECDEFLADAIEFNEEAVGWDKFDFYQNTKIKSSLARKLNLFIVRFAGNYYLRTELKIEAMPIITTVYNPRTRRIEQVKSKIDSINIKMQKPGQGEFISTYEFQKNINKGQKIKEDINYLLSKVRTTIDPSDIPDELDL